MRWMVMALAAGSLAGCVSAVAPGVDVMQPLPVPMPDASGAVLGDAPRLAPRDAARNFITVVDRVKPVAEQICRQRTRNVDCALQIAIDERLDQPPNAFQTIDPQGRPVVGFTVALIADARNADEIAFVLGHEAAHHIAGHIPRSQQSASAGALAGAMIGAMTGADQGMVDQLQQIGATVGGRRYSKEFELEADALGTEIALYAGFDPVLGAGFFNRLPDPGDQFLGSHPPNAQRQAQVRDVVAQLYQNSY